MNTAPNGWSVQRESFQLPVLLSQILDAVPAGLVVVDSTGTPLFANARARELLGPGIDPDAARRTADSRAYPLYFAGTELPYPGDRLPIARALRGERAVIEDVEVRHPRGAIPLTIEAIPVSGDRENAVLAVAVFFEKTERRAAAALQSRLAAIVESSDDAILSFGLDGTIESWNGGAERLYGYAAPEIIGRSLQALLPPDHASETTFILRRVASGERIENYETVRQCKDGSRVHVSITASPVRDATGRIVGATGIARDITDRVRAQQRQKELEEQLRQAEKTEAMGRLAGGVAHDFNTLLTVIGMHAQLIEEALPEDDIHRADITEIASAVDRGSRLTRSLLSYSRKRPVDAIPLSLNDVVTEMLTMMRRLVTEDIELVTSLEPNLGEILSDRGQLEQVIMNLVVNARDAMPDGGELSIKTARAWLDPESAGSSDVHEGEYAELTVSDTGVGMDAAAVSRIFEPYFTTKKHRGTGIGLATVHSIVKQSSGHIAVESEPGMGTRFSLYFPLLGVYNVRNDAEKVKLADIAGGAETILLVEDDDSLCATAKQILEHHGYRVITAHHGREALSVARGFSGAIHLVLTDVVMPELGARDLVEELADSRPDAKVLFMSGYTDDEMLRRGVVKPGFSFVGKPYTRETLLQMVRRTLDETA